MSDERIRETERRWKRSGAKDDFFLYLAELERGGRRPDALSLANARLRNNRTDEQTLTYILERDPLAYTGWVAQEDHTAIRVFDGDENYRVSLDDLCDGNPIENMAYVDGHLYVITQDFIQQTIPQTPGIHKSRALSFVPLADHDNKRMLYHFWSEATGYCIATSDGTRVLGDAPLENLSPTKRILSQRAGESGAIAVTEIDSTYHTLRPYLIEDNSVWYVPVLLPNQFLCPTKNEHSDAITLLISSGATRIPTKSRLGQRCNIAKTPYDLGVLSFNGNVTLLEVDLRCLEALRAMRHGR